MSLQLSESSISRRIRDLEDQLGASLFQRNSSGVTLTLAGRRFLRHVRIALQHIDDGSKDVAAIGRSEKGCVRVGIFSSLASGFLRELLYAFTRNHAGVLVELVAGNPAEHVAAIRQFELDVAFITAGVQWADCDCEQFWSERVFAALPSEHHLVAKEQLEWHDLAGETFIVSETAPGPEIRDYLLQRLAKVGYHPEIHAQLVGRDVLLSMVAVGHGLTLTSEATTATEIPGIRYRPIAEEVMSFSAIWSPRNDNPACRSLLSLARSMVRGGKVAP